MCGITGFITFSGHDPVAARPALKKATDLIHHRGPDEEGFYIDGHAALGHRRLSIIDLSGGQQPMHTEDRRLHVVFNGEIYNFPELRRELEAAGHRFLSKSDTEVILLGYRQWGENVVERLNGMFAFALWDSVERKLFLARDRVGKKPLYFHHRPGFFAFASELKALKPLCPTPDELDPRALDCYFTFGYIPSPLTIYRNIDKLEPGHALAVDADGLRKRKYWQLSFAPRQGLTLDQAGAELEDLLDDATRIRLMSEVPLGAFLSGGLDSTLIVASMARNMDKPVRTNSIGFGEAEFNELPLARLVAEHLHTDHRECTLEPKAADVLGKIAWHFDEPFADSSAVPTWYVCQMARQNVTVALSGDGGDESFGGYTFRYVPHIFESRLRSALPILMRGPIFGPLGDVYPSSTRLPQPLRLKTIFENLARSDAEAYYHDLIFLRADDRAALYSPQLAASLMGFTPFEMIHPLYAGGDAPDALARSQRADIAFYMTEDVLVKVDRMSMAHALEVRSPLLDYRIIEFAARLPEDLKIQGRTGKILLRHLARRRLPAEILDKPKKGFSIPAASWLRGELRPLAEQAIFQPKSLLRDLLQPLQLRRMWDEHQKEIRNHDVLLWGLMMFGLWENKHYNGRLGRYE
ncbi:MAG: asparagine synthase (glutamine-hydrolyzing) [Thermodesulfobacteriota bacterium]